MLRLALGVHSGQGGGPPSKTTFELVPMGASFAAALVAFAVSAGVGVFVVVSFVGLDINSFVSIVLILCFAAAPALLVLIAGEGDECVRVDFAGDAMHLHSSKGGSVVLPSRCVELVVERAPAARPPAPPSYWLYGRSFGRVRLIPAFSEAAAFDSMLRAGAPHALHIPATRGVDAWHWPRRFDRQTLVGALRREGRSRERRWLGAGSLLLGLGVAGVAPAVSSWLGLIAPAKGAGKALGAGVVLSAGGAYWLATTRRTTRWRQGCERIINERCSAPFTCPSCGYDMGGLGPKAPCPECGAAPSAEAPLDARRL